MLVVDDEARFGEQVAEGLRDAGHEVTALASGVDAVAAIGTREFDVVVTDLKMAPVDGIAVLEAARAADSETDVIIMTAYAALETAVAALRRGAYDYITKPFGLDELILLVDRIAEKRALRRENAALRRELAADRRGEMIGTSPALAHVRSLIAKVAPTDTTVLVEGESGVGKELVARHIHRDSPRADRPLVVVHAASLPENLLESELFGYERGAFTGATARKPGRLELAEGGTLFLDEIGEISPAFQVKLLRFVQERTFVRLGGSQTIKVDSRIIAATNRDLRAEVAARRFREDLFYRLSVFPITVPPLRERRGDIPSLCRHILAGLGAPAELDAAVLRLLAGHDWPGNIRELENVLERALILAAGEPVAARHIQLPEPVLARPSDDRPAGTPLAAMERQMVEDALRKAGNNKSRAAKLLGITRRTLYTKLRNLGIEFSDDDPDAAG